MLTDLAVREGRLGVHDRPERRSFDQVHQDTEGLFVLEGRMGFGDELVFSLGQFFEEFQKADNISKVHPTVVYSERNSVAFSI